MVVLSTNITESDDCVSATARSRMNLALHHLFAACRFTARIGEVETENAGSQIAGFWEEIFHNALGVATLSAAAVECYANELFFEGGAITSALNPAATSIIAEKFDNESVVRKYAAILAIRTGKELDMGAPKIQNIEALIKLRNAIIHFRPEWFEEQDKHKNLSNILKYKFTTSEFLPNEPIFPRAWASHSFASWALSSTVEFIEYFHDEAGLPNPLSAFAPHFRELSSNAL